MSTRSIILGLLLAAFISAATYYNDFVIRQPSLVNHLLPVSVFGSLVLLVLLVNPLLRTGAAPSRLERGELAVIVALGLAACAWPGAGFFRTAATNLAMPAYFYKTDASWRTHAVLAYVPGQSNSLAPGHVQDWEKLRSRLAAGTLGEDHLAQQVHEALSPAGRATLKRLLAAPLTRPEERLAVLNLLREALRARPINPVAPTPGDAAPMGGAPDDGSPLRENLRLLSAAWPDALLPPPRGWPLLPTTGEPAADEAFLDTLISPPPPEQPIRVDAIPWARWGPPLALWGGLALLFGIASLCLAVIVHPQWSRRELLSYPIPRFVDELTRRTPGARLPDIARQRGFWIAFAAMVSLHAINGLHRWFERFPEVPLTLDFNPLRDLFPIASTIPDATAYFWPTLFPSVIAFTFFLHRSVSFSLGIAPLLYILIASLFVSSGARLDNEYLGAGEGNLLRFGAYLGAAAVILYNGRAYYGQVAAGALRLPIRTPPSAALTWAARGFAAASLLCVVVLHQAGLGWFLAATCTALILVMLLVLARVAAETGMFFLQPYWMPVGVITAILGAQAVGPTPYIILALASVMIVGDTRTALLPNLVHALKIADDHRQWPSARLTRWILIVIVAGFLIAAGATLLTVHRHGVLHTDLFTREQLPRMPFDHATQVISDLAAQGQLAEATRSGGGLTPDRLELDAGMLGWLAAGLLLFLATGWARLRLPGWPLHPVVFLIWGTFPSARFAFSFLLGWALKAAVVQLGGTRAFARVLPFMVGIIAGEMAAAVAWWLMGAAYRCLTGLPAPDYSVIL